MDKKCNYAWPVTTLAKYDYDVLMECINKNKEIFAKKKIVIFGAGIRGTSFSLLLKRMGYNDIYFTDNNLDKIGGYINEYPILHYDMIEMMKEEVVIIISVENGYSIKQQLEKSGFVEDVNYYFIENHIYENYLEEFSINDNISCLVMGDCGLTDVSIKDKDYTNLGDMLKQKKAEEKIKVLAIHGMGMRAYYHILKVHINKINKPDKVIIMSNFETFTSKHHILPRTQHEKLIEMINTYVNAEDKELDEYSKITKERFSNTSIDYFTTAKSDFSQKKEDRNDRLVIKMNYMYKINLECEGVKYMFKIIELCKNNNIKLKFFIPPVNYQYAEQLFGEVFYEKYEDNCLRLKTAVERQKVEILDLSYVLDSNQFADLHTIDETANYEGRTIISDMIFNKLINN